MLIMCAIHVTREGPNLHLGMRNKAILALIRATAPGRAAAQTKREAQLTATLLNHVVTAVTVVAVAVWRYIIAGVESRRALLVEYMGQ